MNQILMCCDWLPERARWHSGLPALSWGKIAFFIHVTNPLLTRFVGLVWLDFGQLLFDVFMDRDGES